LFSFPFLPVTMRMRALIWRLLIALFFFLSVAAAVICDLALAGSVSGSA
jgi:hypothetical protein